MKRGEAGFTIMEALVAFAILSLMLVAIYAASGTALRGVGRAQGVERAVLLAQSKLAEIAALRTTFPATSKGSFAGTQVRWRIDATDVHMNAMGALRLQDIHLELTWPEDDATRTIAVDTRHLGWLTE